MSILGFEIEWFDQLSETLQHLFLKFFIDDNTIEILKDKSTFLKRIYYPDVKFTDLFLGNSLTIHNRLYMIKKYANSFTQQYMKDREIHYLGIIPGRHVRDVGKFLLLAKQYQLTTGHIYTTSIDTHYQSEGLDQQVYRVQTNDVLVEVVGLSGNLNSNVSNRNRRNPASDPFLADVAQKLGDAVVVQASVEDIQGLLHHCQGLVIDFPCTLCLVKPHIIKNQRLGEVLNYILENNYSVFGLFSIHLTVPMLEEFFDVYRNVFPNYSQYLESLADGPCVAIGIMGNYLDEDWPASSHSNRKYNNTNINNSTRSRTTNSNNIVADFRDFTGPQNPELAKILRPKSLRAQFGETVVQNAIHCTDLSTDGDMECRYFFETLANLK